MQENERNTPLLETITSQQSTAPIIESDQHKKTFSLCQKFFALILILGRFCSTFIGTTVYFYIMVQMVFTYFEKLITDIFLGKIYFFFSDLFSIFISIPIIHLIFYQIILLFFTFFQDLKQFLNIKDQIEEICSALNSPKTKCHIFFLVMGIIIYIYQAIFVIFVFVVFIVTMFIDVTANNSFDKSYRIILFSSIFSCVLLPVFQLFFCMIHPIIKSCVSDLFVIKNTQSRSTSSDSILNRPIENENRLSNSTNENQEPNGNLSHISKIETEEYNPIQILDPFYFLNAQEYTDYIDEVYDTLINDIFFYKLYIHSSKDEDKKKKICYIFSIAAFNIILFASIIIYILGNISYKHKSSEWGSFAVSIIFEIMFIFFTFTSIVFIFTNFPLVKKHKNVYYLWIAIFSLFSLMLIAPFLLWLIFSTPRKINYNYSPYLNNLTIGNPAPICFIDYYDLNLVQYAGLAALGHSTSEQNANEIVKLLFSDSSKFKNISTHLNETKYGHTFQIKLNSSLSIVAINSLIDLQDYAFVLENFIMDVVTRKLMGIIPMFDTLFNIVFFEIINYITELSTFNNNLASRYFAEFIYNSYEYIIKQNITAVYTGYSAGGMLAKTLGIEYNVPSIAFNCLQTYYSTFSHMYKLFINNQKIQRNKHKGYSLPFDYFIHRKTVKMINLYSPNQMLSMPEKGPTINIEVPNVKIKDSIEMMCLIASGCDVSGKYDNFCQPILGYKKYMHFFDLWNRSRTNQI